MKKIVSFFEIPASDFNRAVKFYENVFGVKLSVFECESEKMACFPEEDGLSPGAVSWQKGFNPSADGVLVSLWVADMQKAVGAIEANGGRIVHPRTKILDESRGWFALFTDSEGNKVGLYSDN